MENIDLNRIPDEPIEEGNDVVDRVDSDSSSDSNVGNHPDSGSDSDYYSAKSEVISETAGMRTAVEAVYKNVCPGFTGQAKLKSFQEISKNMEKAGEGLGKVKLAWFGGSKDEISNIVRVRPAVQANPARANAATSGEPMIPVAQLILELGTGSPMNVKRWLMKIYGDFREKKITKQELTEKLRQPVGDDVLYRTIMSVRRRWGESEEAAPGVSSSAEEIRCKVKRK